MDNQTVAELRQKLGCILNITPDAVAYINGERARTNQRVNSGDVLEFRLAEYAKEEERERARLARREKRTNELFSTLDYVLGENQDAERDDQNAQ